MPEPRIVTYSQLSTFRDCRKKAQWRYEEQIVPTRWESDAKTMGSSFALAAEVFFKSDGDLEAVNEVLSWRETAAPMHAFALASERIIAREGIRAYASHWAGEPIKPLGVEVAFEVPIRNPRNKLSKHPFRLAGKIDRYTEIDGELWVVEQKSTGGLDSGYLDRLWTSFQSEIYVEALELMLQRHVAGTIFDLIERCELKRSQGETEEEFVVRRDSLLARSKTGKTTATRWVMESEEDFSYRVAQWYLDRPRFLRQHIVVGKDRREYLRRELWELCREYFWALKEGYFSSNPTHCFHWNRPCDYWRLCLTNGSEVVRQNEYRVEKPHRELLPAWNRETHHANRASAAAPPAVGTAANLASDF